MNALLRFSRLIDALNQRIGTLVYWLVLAAVLISSGNAMMRYVFSISSNAWLELQWYLFSAVFLLCAGYTLLRNEHIRIDIVAGMTSRRTQTWIDILGSLLFLVPISLIIMWLSWPVFTNSVCGSTSTATGSLFSCFADSAHWERSTDAGGLIRWPVKILIPIGFLLLALQGISELIKRIAYLQGRIPDPAEKQHGGHGTPPEGEPV